jgi:hypothetical protein
LHISSSDVILLAHAAFGVTGCVAAIWVLVEALNTRPANSLRIQTAALVAGVCMGAAWICCGYWYLHFYPVEKELILQGPWPFAHNVFMETKEHLFFVTAILAFLLPIAAHEKLYSNSAARTLVLVVGHADTVPLIIERPGGGSVPPIRDDEYDRMTVLFLAPRGKAQVVTLRYGN